MATGGQADISEEDIFEVTGSEAVFDHVCQPCSEETTKEAVGYCVDCAEWLCEECFRTHRRPKQIRHHVLKDMEQMKNFASSKEIVDKCTETCESHNGKKLKYYCPAHDVLGCSKCIFKSHRICEIQHITDVCKEVDTMNEFQQIIDNLEQVTVTAREIVSDLKTKVELVNVNKGVTVNAFRKYGKKLNESVNTAVFSLEAQCVEREEEETTRLKVISETCQTNEKESLILKSQLEAFEQNGQYCNMFVTMKRKKSKLQTLDTSIKQAKYSSRINTFTFLPNLDVDKILNGSGIGTLVRHARRDEADYSNIQVQHITDISIKLENNCICRITGSVCLPKDKLVLTDYNNCQVKVVNTDLNRVVSVADVDGHPLDVCKAGDNTVAITNSDRKRISILTVDQSGDISKLKDISVKSNCKAVAVVDDLIIVTYQCFGKTYQCPGKMEIMDLDGSVLHKFKINDQGVNIDITPQYVCPSFDNDYLIVSNSIFDSVVCVRLFGTGTVVHTYKDEELLIPEQVAVDKNGMLYVGCHNSNNVHLITPDCKKIKVILDESDGLKNVNAVCYCEHTDRLYIGMNKCDIIKVFQLSF